MTTEQEISLNCQLTAHDLYRFSLTTLRRKLWWFLLIICFSSLYFVYNVLTNRISWNAQAIAATLFMFVFMPYAFFIAPYLSARKRFRTDPRLQQLISYTFSPSEIVIRASVGDSRLNWTAFAEVLETRKYFLLYPQSALAHVLPKRCFASQAEVEAFRQLLRSAALKARLHRT
jgi:YcxB-like protein